MANSASETVQVGRECGWLCVLFVWRVFVCVVYLYDVYSCVLCLYDVCSCVCYVSMTCIRVCAVHVCMTCIHVCVCCMFVWLVFVCVCCMFVWRIRVCVLYDVYSCVCVLMFSSSKIQGIRGHCVGGACSHNKACRLSPFPTSKIIPYWRLVRPTCLGYGRRSNVGVLYCNTHSM